MNHYLFATVKFKRKFERIIWTFWVKDGLPYFDLYFINKKDQKLPIELDDKYSEYAKKTLLHHYEVTQNSILKDIWKPWNKIILSIPPYHHYSVTLTEEIKEPNWKFTLPDGTAIEICSNQFPKILTLDKVNQPISGKVWRFNLDISNNKADYVPFYNFFFPYGSTSIEGNLSGNNLTASFDNYTVNEAMKSAKFFSYKELTLTTSAGKSFIKTIKGKELRVVIENVTEAKFTLF